MSPQMKRFLPLMAEKYGFEYEVVTYKWPTWLHKQVNTTFPARFDMHLVSVIHCYAASKGASCCSCIRLGGVFTHL